MWSRMPSSSKLATALGATCFLVGVVGYVAFGWRFDSGGSSTATIAALVAALVALTVTLRD